MKFYSELTENLYDSIEQLQEAEEARQKELDAARAKEIEKERLKQDIEEQYAYLKEMITTFNEKYGAITFVPRDEIDLKLSNLFPFFNFFR